MDIPIPHTATSSMIEILVQDPSLARGSKHQLELQEAGDNLKEGDKRSLGHRKMYRV
ncbi:hypothetical protein K3495_g745 [Podosphaera aphanis]|nr:hypothetical protein K3495_g745 [Podosphaera aphanis]